MKTIHVQFYDDALPQAIVVEEIDFSNPNRKKGSATWGWHTTSGTRNLQTPGQKERGTGFPDKNAAKRDAEASGYQARFESNRDARDAGGAPWQVVGDDGSRSRKYDVYSDAVAEAKRRNASGVRAWVENDEGEVDWQYRERQGPARDAVRTARRLNPRRAL